MRTKNELLADASLDPYGPGPVWIEDSDTVTLPGFIEDGVDFRAHTFYFLTKTRSPGKHRQNAKIAVRHGAGWRTLDLSWKTANAVRVLIEADDTKSAYWLLWESFYFLQDAYLFGRDAERRKVYAHFANGRLKKRKIRGLGMSLTAIIILILVAVSLIAASGGVIYFVYLLLTCMETYIRINRRK